MGTSPETMGFSHETWAFPVQPPSPRRLKVREDREFPEAAGSQREPSLGATCCWKPPNHPLIDGICHYKPSNSCIFSGFYWHVPFQSIYLRSFGGAPPNLGKHQIWKPFRQNMIHDDPCGDVHFGCWTGDLDAILSMLCFSSRSLFQMVLQVPNVLLIINSCNPIGGFIWFFPALRICFLQKYLFFPLVETTS